jgi:hypothetical protein
MCDPVTITAAASLGSGYAAYGASATALVGSGLTASAITTQSLMTAASVGLTVGSGVMSMYNQKASSDMQKAKFEAQKQRYKSEEKSAFIEEKAATNKRKRDYVDNYNKKLALQSRMGRTLQSGSTDAILSADRNVLKRDLDYIGLSGFEKRLYNSQMAQESELAKQAVDPTADMFGTAVSTGLATKSLLKEIT